MHVLQKPNGESWGGLELVCMGLNNCRQLGVTSEEEEGGAEQISEPITFAGGACCTCVPFPFFTKKDVSKENGHSLVHVPVRGSPCVFCIYHELSHQVQ